MPDSLQPLTDIKSLMNNIAVASRKAGSKWHQVNPVKGGIINDNGEGMRYFQRPIKEEAVCLNVWGAGAIDPKPDLIYRESSEFRQKGMTYEEEIRTWGKAEKKREAATKETLTNIAAIFTGALGASPGLQLYDGGLDITFTPETAYKLSQISDVELPKSLQLLRQTFVDGKMEQVAGRA